MKTNVILWITVVILVMTLLFREGCNQKKIEGLNADISTYQLKEQTLQDSIRNKNGEIVKLQKAVVFEGEKGKKALSKYADSVFNLKKKDERKYKETIVYYENIIKSRLRDTIYIPIDTGNYIISGDTLEYLANSIRVPKDFKTESQYFSIKGQIQKSQLRIDSISMPDTIRGRFIEKKNGWFKANTIEYQVFNTNPNIDISNSKSAIYKQRKKSLKFIVPVVIGIVLGFLIAK